MPMEEKESLIELWYYDRIVLMSIRLMLVAVASKKFSCKLITK